MTDDYDAATRLRDDIISLQIRAERHAAIIAGTVFPSFDDLQRGLPFAQGDFILDLQTYIQTLLLDTNVTGELRAALGLALANPVAETLRAAADATVHAGSHESRRLDLYAAWLGDPTGRDRMVRRGFEDLDASDLTTGAFSTALALGLSRYAPRRFGTVKVHADAGERMIRSGVEFMHCIAGLIARLVPALEGVEDDNAALQETMAESGEDRGEIVIADGIPEHLLGNPPVPEAQGAIVVPAMDPKAGATSQARDIIKSWSGIAGERLPIVQVGDIAASAARLTARWPYARDVIHTILSDLALGGDVVFRPTVLVGEPGSGKTALLRGIADEFGLPSQAYDLGGAADSSLMGTSSRFNTAEESAVLQLIKRERKATVCLIWDELDKPTEGRHNGNPHDAMLPYLVRHQAKRLRDPCLNVEVDLSYVSHFGTANTMKGVPAPLRDRMRILRMPSPGWQHLGALTEQILDGIAERWGHNRGWYPPLAEDELDVIRDAWAGGSIRRLERYVEILVAGRDQHTMGRA